MSVVFPIAFSLLITVAWLVFIYIRLGRDIRGVAMVPYGLVFVAVLVYRLALQALGYTADTLTLTIATAVFTLASCAFLTFRRAADSRPTAWIRGLSLAAVIVIALELSVFSYTAYASPRGREQPLTDSASVPGGSDVLQLNADSDTTIDWTVDEVDVNNIALTLRAERATPVTVSVMARDRNFSTVSINMFAQTTVINGTVTEYLPLSSRGTSTLTLTFGKASGVTLTAVSLNAAKPLHPNLLRMFLLILLAGFVTAIKAFGWHRKECDSKRLTQKFVCVAAAALCIVVLVQISAAHVNSASELLTDYDGWAYGKDPYYQLFDAFQKGQLHLDIQADPKLAAAGELAYDSGYRADNGISAEWDRAYYDGKYYSYFGVAPVLLFYYPVYFVTGKVPATALACMFFSILCVIFGFMLVFRISRTVVRGGNFLLTLLGAVALPLMAGVYILTAYGDFYNLPKLCALAFLLLLYYLTIDGYERPRWWVFLLCGVCVAVMMAARPNVVIMALALAPMYLGVLASKTLELKKKLLCVGVFLLPIAAALAGLAAYNMARFGSPTEFGARYQLTVNNIAMNNLSLGFFGMAFYHYFLQPAELRATFPFILPQYKELDTYTRYFYITAVYGVMNLPLNWSLAAYPAIRKRCDVKPAYRATLVMSVVMALVLSLLDFAMAGVTISYICDLAVMVALAAVTVALIAEKCARGAGAVHKGVYIALCALSAATIAVAVLLLLGTEPLFVRNSMPETYGAIQSLFRF